MNATIATMRRAAIYCTFGAAALITFSTSVLATEVTRIKRVQFDDLNVVDPAGAKVLYRRIRAAAQEVCASYHRRELMQACVRNAIDDGVMKVNAPTLTALVRTKNIRKISK